jgi:hypothetical protein
MDPWQIDNVYVECARLQVEATRATIAEMRSTMEESRRILARSQELLRRIHQTESSATPDEGGGSPVSLAPRLHAVDRCSLWPSDRPAASPYTC